MEISAPILLLTRPRPQSEEFAAACVREFGEAVPILISPVLRIAAVDVSIELDRYDFLVVSSGNALWACEARLLEDPLPVFCVGPQTAELARSMGLTVLATAPTARELAETIVAAQPKGRGLFLRGDRVAHDLTRQLESSGIETDSVIAYRQDEQPLSPDAREVLNGSRPVLIPVFSPRSAIALASQLRDARAPLHIVAISRNTADAWSGKVQSMSVAGTPDRSGMLQAVATYLRS